jgi:hypothetical protein
MTEVLTYEALKADRDAQQKRADVLAVENVELKLKAAELVQEASTVYAAYNATIREPDGDSADFQTLHEMHCVIETPATSAAIAAIRLEAKIEGANELAERIAEMHSKTAPGSNIEKKLMFAAEASIAYANGLREAK